MMYDYLVVGCGLAGICFAEKAIQNHKSVVVIDKGNSSSEVAGGVFNAVILKRFTLSGNAQKQIVLLREFYAELEKKLGIDFLHYIKTYRRIASIEEQNNFVVASDKPLFKEFLSSEILSNPYTSVIAPYGLGEIYQTGYLDTSLLINSYKKYLTQQESLLEENFDYDKLKIHEDFVEYNGIKAKKVIFAEGMGLKNNPYFGELPLDGVKGELLIIRSKELKTNAIIKSDIFILPICNDLYKVGATYNWSDKTTIPTEEAKQELLEGLEGTINCEFEVVEHFAGIRPTVRDRKPLVGRHFEYSNLYVLNGLGTRGVMQAPYYAEKLFDFIEFDLPLEHEANIARIYNKKSKCE